MVASKLSDETSKFPRRSIVLHSVLKAGPRMLTIRKAFRVIEHPWNLRIKEELRSWMILGGL